MTRTKLLNQLDEAFMNIFKEMRHKSEHAVCLSHALDKVMMIIGLHETPPNVKQLATILGVTSGGATQHVAALEEAGLVTRGTNPDNRRETTILLTSKGTETLQGIRAHHQKLLQELFGGLDEGELATLVGLIEKAHTTYKENGHE